MTSLSDLSKGRLWIMAKLDDGLCGRCGKRPLVTKSRCQVCRKKHAATGNRARKRRTTMELVNV